MALGGAALIAAWLGAVSAQPVAPAPTPADVARLRQQVNALTAETPVANNFALPAVAADKTPGSIRARLQAAEALLRRVGLDPRRFSAPAVAVGGPYLPIVAARTAALPSSYEQVAAMEAAIAAIPSYVPVKSYTFTSPFGVRTDPFNGHSAMHAGLDMSGVYGEPIYAAADGVIVTGGKSGAYGNLVEIDHGKGLATRYGHLSAILVQPGAHVRQGQLIARMGSTGRSTGTHLHYEIRLDGRAINPRPFLDASAFVLAAQGVSPVPGPMQHGHGFDGPSLADLTPDDTVSYTLVTKGLAPTVVRN